MLLPPPNPSALGGAWPGEDRIPQAAIFRWGPAGLADGDMPDVAVADWAARRIASSLPQPWLAAIGFRVPHLPWCVPDRYHAAFPSAAVELPPGRLAPGKGVVRIYADLPNDRQFHAHVERRGVWQELVASYLAAMLFADDCVGRVLGALRQSGEEANTVVVVTSDHGFHLGEHRHWGKCTLWEPATRIPLIVSVPFLGPGPAYAEAVSLLDVYPTVLDLCGFSPPPGLDGRSLRPVLEGRVEPTESAALIMAPTKKGWSLRTRHCRFTWYPTGHRELYDYATDPHERHNLAWEPEFCETEGALGRRLQAALEEQRQRGGTGREDVR